MDETSEQIRLSRGVDADHDLIVRIDERTKNWEQTLKTFVTTKEFFPVKSLVYGLVGLILVGVIGGILSLILHK